MILLKEKKRCAMSLRQLTAVVLFCLVLPCLIPDLKAQQWIASTSDKKEAYQHLKTLQEANLIFVLNTESKKLNELERIQSDPKSTKGAKKRAAKQSKKIAIQRRQFSLELAQALDTIYTFSPYRLIFDYDLKDHLDGQKHLFLTPDLGYYNDSTHVSSSISYFAREGYMDGSEGARTLSYIVYDNNFDVMRFPFPSVKITDVGPAMLIRSIFEKNEYRPGSSIIKRLDELLHHRLAMLEEDLLQAELD